MKVNRIARKKEAKNMEEGRKIMRDSYYFLRLDKIKFFQK